MGTLVVEPHGRLADWVAHERGFFAEEGLDYRFNTRHHHPADSWIGSARTIGGGGAARQGAVESFAVGRSCDLSSACHWAVTIAARSGAGRMWGKAYSVCPAGVYVGPDSPIRTPDDLADVEIAVGYHSGSHFSTLQALDRIVPEHRQKLVFAGLPLDRLQGALDGRLAAVSVWSASLYLLELQGFRRILDTSFVVGHIVAPGVANEDVERYFRALRLAQREIDAEPERHKHYFRKELPRRLHHLADVRAFGLGERIVSEPYTRRMFERTQAWMRSRGLLAETGAGRAYADAVIS